jgi:hypothetical protein
LVNDVQIKNTRSPIVVTDVFDKSIVVSKLQFTNAYNPILVNVIGNVMVVNELHPSNAEFGIVWINVFDKFMV